MVRAVGSSVKRAKESVRLSGSLGFLQGKREEREREYINSYKLPIRYISHPLQQSVHPLPFEEIHIPF